MSIVKNGRKRNFTVVPNEVFEDVKDGELISDASLGLLCYLLSKPADWNVSIASLAKRKQFGSPTKVCATLKDLRERSYAKLERHGDGTTTWTIFDEKQAEPHSRNDNGAGPHSKNPHVEKPHVGFEHVLNKDLQPKKDEEPTTPAPSPEPDAEPESATPRRRAAKAPPPKPHGTPELPPWLDAKLWAGFKKWRSDIKKPMTPFAEELAIGKLAKLRDQGNDPAEVIAQSVTSNWSGLFPVKRGNGNSNGPNGDGNDYVSIARRPESRFGYVPPEKGGGR